MEDNDLGATAGNRDCSIRCRIILYSGPTNSGKSTEAYSRTETYSSGIVFSPIRALAHEGMRELIKRGKRCALCTGEEIGRSARNTEFLAATVDSRHEAFLSLDKPQLIIIDEVQNLLLGDAMRWTQLLRVAARTCYELILCGPSSDRLRQEIKGVLGRIDHERVFFRRSELTTLERPVSLEALGPGDCLVGFSIQALWRLREQLEGAGTKTAILLGCLPARLREELAAQSSEVVLLATDVIGQGVNLQIRRVIFASLEKFDGNVVRELLCEEVRQVAGRAGRGLTPGFVGVLDGENSLKSLKQLQRAMAPGIDPLIDCVTSHIVDMEKPTVQRLRIEWCGDLSFVAEQLQRFLATQANFSDEEDEYWAAAQRIAAASDLKRAASLEIAGKERQPIGREIMLLIHELDFMTSGLLRRATAALRWRTRLGGSQVKVEHDLDGFGDLEGIS